MDWTIFSRFAAPIVALFIGAWLSRIIERRPNVVYFLSHVSAIPLRDEMGTQVNTHSIVIRNAGKKEAKNVRIHHVVLPTSFNISPSIEYEICTLPDGSQDIVIPFLVPQEQITISYLYFPPTLYLDVSGEIKHETGFAKLVTVFPTPIYPKWVTWIVRFFLLLGVTTFLYIVFEIIRRWALPHLPF